MCNCPTSLSSLYHGTVSWINLKNNRPTEKVTLSVFFFPGSVWQLQRKSVTTMMTVLFAGRKWKLQENFRVDIYFTSKDIVLSLWQFGLFFFSIVHFLFIKKICMCNVILLTFLVIWWTRFSQKLLFTFWSNILI